MAVALQQRAIFASSPLSTFPESEFIRLRKVPKTILSREEYLKGIFPDLMTHRKQKLPSHWRYIADHVFAGEFSDRFAYGLLHLMELSYQPTENCKPAQFLSEIAVHEVAAFALSEGRRMQLRIKKRIPVPLFSIWDLGQSTAPNDEITKLIRDAYLNLAPKGLEHIALYLIVFSKVGQNVPSFENYIKQFSNQWRPHLRAFRETTLRSSRKHLAGQIASRIATLCDTLQADQIKDQPRGKK